MQFGADLNAYTSFDETVTCCRCRRTRGLRWPEFRFWRTGRTSLRRHDRDQQRERGVVIEEWRLGLGAEARMRDQYFPCCSRSRATPSDCRSATRPRSASALKR
jgi:zinc protease